MSTWNMPPGVSTRDIPGDEAERYDEDEAAEEAYADWKAEREDYD